MPKAKIEFLQASWLDIDRISDFYLREVGPVSAEKAIDEIMEHIGILGEHPYAGPLHPDPVLAKQEYRKYEYEFRRDIEGVPCTDPYPVCCGYIAEPAGRFRLRRYRLCNDLVFQYLAVMHFYEPRGVLFHLFQIVGNYDDKFIF